MECSEKVRYLKKWSQFRNNKLLHMYNIVITYISMRIKLHAYMHAHVCVLVCAHLGMWSPRHFFARWLYTQNIVHTHFLQTCRITKKIPSHHIAPTYCAHIACAPRVRCRRTLGRRRRRCWCRPPPRWCGYAACSRCR